jgi:outer membrane receptor protein involved in Fe transport
MIEGFNDAWDEWDYRFLGSVYIQDEIAIIPDKLTVTPGVKYLYAHTSDTDHVGFFYPNKGTAAGDEGFISPTVGFNYKPISTFAIYGAFGQNIKFPDISAFYNNIQTDINGNLLVPPVQVKPEHVNDYELGARYQSGGLSLAVNVYREDFTNTFVTISINNGNNSEVINGGSSRYQGVEVQFQDAFHWLDSDWTAYANYAHNQAKFTSSFMDQASGNAVLAGTPLANVPQDLVSAGGTWSWRGWEANLSLRYVGKQFTDQFQLGTVPTPNTIPSYVVVDLGVAKRFSVQTMGRSGSVKIGINVDNLFDERYFNEAFTDTDNMGNSFLRPVVGAPLGVTGSISAKF